jgi:bile acid:Na+ symporter, BASS family
MNEIMQFFQPYFQPVVTVFTISNLLTMGLQVNIPEVAKKLSNPKLLVMIFLWGWVLGPALAFLIVTVIPLAAPFVIVMYIASLAPSAPFLPPMIGKARGDVAFAGAFIPLAVVGTVIFLPLFAPFLIKGIEIDALALATPLVITMLIPLIIGAIIKTYAVKVADKIFLPVKKLAGLSTLITIILCLLLYWELMISTAGSFALLSMTIFMVVIAMLTYFLGFGLKQNERSVMSLGIGTRNIAAVLIGVLAIPNGDPSMLAMTILWTLWSIILAFVYARILNKRVLNPASTNT